MLHTTATVLRQPTSEPQELPLRALVPGDIVHLTAGDMIPAVLRLIVAKDLYLNQDSLTGEALPVEKLVAPLAPGVSELAQLENICFTGTSVVSGIRRWRDRTDRQPRLFWTSSLADSIAGKRLPTSFDTGIDRFATLMVRFILVMAPLVFLINGLTLTSLAICVVGILLPSSAPAAALGLCAVAASVLAVVDADTDVLPDAHVPCKELVVRALWPGLSCLVANSERSVAPIHITRSIAANV